MSHHKFEASMNIGGIWYFKAHLIVLDKLASASPVTNCSFAPPLVWKMVMSCSFARHNTDLPAKYNLCLRMHPPPKLTSVKCRCIDIASWPTLASWVGEMDFWGSLISSHASSHSPFSLRALSGRPRLGHGRIWWWTWLLRDRTAAVWNVYD